MEHGKPIFLHMEVPRAHRDVGRGSLKKRRPSCRSLFCTELVADWAFSLIKADQLAFFLSKSRSNRAAPCPLSLMFRGGIRPRTTSLVVVRKAQTPRTSRAPFTKKKASTRTTFLLRADVAKCLTLLVIVPCCCGWCSFARA